MNIVDVILDKRYGRELTDEQIEFFVKGVTDKSIPDYQISALLMAIVLNGMNEREMTTLTLQMASSGEINDLSYVDGIAVDKHSTGGVGDKVTPLVMPLCATFGVNTVKLSGRGLGFTGGTVDKFALIASSIMSKKIAGGADAIVLDVTCGSGAFMKTPERARELATAMIKIGNLAGRKTVAVITDMDQPLGKTCGNVLEMQEVYDTLTGKGSPDVVEVVCNIATEMIMLAGKNEGLTHDELLIECTKRLLDGRALEKYFELILAQGGEVNSDGSLVYKDSPFEALQVRATEDGYIASIQTETIGHASVALGAGRIKKTDDIDYGAGLIFYAKPGMKIHRGDVICSLCLGKNSIVDEDKLWDVMEMVNSAFTYSSEPVEEHHAVIDVIR